MFSITASRHIQLLSVALILLAGCSGGGGGGDGPVDPGGGTVTPVTPTPSGDAGYSVTLIEPSSGYTSLEANAVNDAGIVVGTTSALGGGSFTANNAFARIGNTIVHLTTGKGISFGIDVSNGSTVYVAGSADTAVSPPLNTVPVRWTLNGTGTPVLKVLEDANGAARGVNDAGDVVGAAIVGTTSQAIMWLANGTRILVTPPAGFTQGTGRDINNAGIAVFVFNGQFDNAFLRLQSGELVPLPPAAGDVMSFATAIGEVMAGAVYVSGISAAQGLTRFRATRWKVELASKTVTQSTPLAYDSEAGGVSNDGLAPIRAINAATDRPQLWNINVLNTLQLPVTGASLVSADAISPNGRFVSGNVESGIVSTGVLWSK